MRRTAETLKPATPAGSSNTIIVQVVSAVKVKTLLEKLGGFSALTTYLSTGRRRDDVFVNFAELIITELGPLYVVPLGHTSVICASWSWRFRVTISPAVTARGSDSDVALKFSNTFVSVDGL